MNFLRRLPLALILIAGLSAQAHAASDAALLEEEASWQAPQLASAASAGGDFQQPEGESVAMGPVEGRDDTLELGAALTAPDYDGLKRDTYYFLGLQWVAIGVLYAMPESVSAWDDEEKSQYSFSKWKDNVTNPVWDKDEWYINYILHPYWGATYYTRGRNRGLTPTGGFWYSAGLSAAYEFGAEALFEPVSIQDLIFTPVGGYFMGNWFLDMRQGVMSRSHEPKFYDSTIMLMTDPIGVFGNAMDRWLGLGEYAEVTPVVGAAPSSFQVGAYTAESGFDPLLESPLSGDPVYGLQFRARW